MIGNGERERGALARLGFYPYASTMALHNFLADGQTDAGSGIFVPRVEPLKNDEDPIGILWIDPDAMITHGKYPFACRALRGDMNARRLFATEFDGVAQQILKQLHQLSF